MIRCARAAILTFCLSLVMAGGAGLPGAGWTGTELLWDAVGTASGFTAVGNSGVVVTSADGRTWQQQPRTTGQALLGVGTDTSTVVAAGTGAPWTSHCSPSPPGRPDGWWAAGVAPS
jgi:hypothetical protein